MQPQDPTRTSNTNYRTVFNTTSLGTEEELLGPSGGQPPIVRTRVNAGQVIGVVRKAGSSEVLVEITKDMQAWHDQQDPAYGGFKIELRTTPTEVDAGPAWDERTRALQVATTTISGTNDKPLLDDTYAGYETRIFNTDHKIYATSVDNSERQATVGVGATALAQAAVNQDRRRGKLHPYVELPWYECRFEDRQAVRNLAEWERIAYSLVMSAIWKLACIFEDEGTNLDSVRAKNSWIVRPRTSPMLILMALSPESRKPALLSIARAKDRLPVMRSIRRPMANHWRAAHDHITTLQPMGGHHPPNVSINGEPAMLFEYRTAPTDLYDHAFWQMHRWVLT